MKNTIKNINKLKKQALLSDAAYCVLIKRHEARLRIEVAINDEKINSIKENRLLANKSNTFSKDSIISLLSFS